MKLPMPQSYRTSELRVQWETNANPAGTVNALDWGVASPGEHTVLAQTTIALAPDRFLHRALATGLSPATSHVYRVRSGPASSATYAYRTAGLANAPFRMAWIADNQDQAGAPFVSTLQAIAPHAPNVIGHAGDTVQNGDVLAEWQSQWFDPFAAAGNLGQRTPVLVARGNHDGQFPPAIAYHWLPGNEHWYAETIGRVRFIFLDSNIVATTQDAFLAAELASPAAQSADFVVVAFHHPPYTVLWNAVGFNGMPYERNFWVPLFEQHDVDLVISGHAHAYERGVQNGVTYLIVGGAGGVLDTVLQPAPWPFFSVALPVHHFGLLDASPGTLRWVAYDLSGAIIDQFELTSQVPGIPVFPFVGASR